MSGLLLGLWKFLKLVRKFGIIGSSFTIAEYSQLFEIENFGSYIQKSWPQILI
jgi:hypothetical protein